MPLLHWNEYDLIGCLEVEPVVDEDQVRHEFVVRRGGVELRLNVWQYGSVAQIGLATDAVAEPLIEEQQWCVRSWGTECLSFARPKNSWEHKSMWEDPIVAEVHRNREKLAAECNFDIKAFFAGLRKRQATLGERLVRKKRAETTAEGDQGRPSGFPMSTSLPA